MVARVQGKGRGVCQRGEQRGRAARIHTVLHPLDAFATTRMLVAQEKAGQIEAERFRKSIVGAVVRRDTIAATSHPHGALGVDSVDNEASAVYGELAARRRLPPRHAPARMSCCWNVTTIWAGFPPAVWSSGSTA